MKRFSQAALPCLCMLFASCLCAQGLEPPLSPATPQNIPSAPAAPAPAPGLAPPVQPAMPEGTYNPVDPPAPQVHLRVRVPARVAPGAELTYTITVENPSLVPAHRVRVRSSAPTSSKFLRAVPQPENEGQELVWNLGTLQPSAKKTISLTVEADGTGDVDNTARVSFEHGETTKTRVASAMQIIKKGPSQAQVQDTWTYTIDIQNTGQTPLANLKVTDILPDGLDFLTSQPSTKGENPLSWTLDRLEPQQVRRIEYQVSAKKPGTYDTKASVSIAGGSKREASWKTVVSEPKLDLILAGPDFRAVNRPATYHITVTNESNTTAQNVRLSTKMAQGVTFLAASSGGREFQGEVRWDLGILQPGQRRSVNFVVRANSPIKLIQRVEMTADKLGLGLQAEKGTTFSGKDPVVLELDKSIDPIELGEPGTYTIRLINRGSTLVNNPGLVVTMPESFGQVDGRGPTQASKNGSTITFAPLTRLEPGREAVYSITATGKQPGSGKILVEMTGTLEGANPGPKLQEGVQVLPSKAIPAR